MAMPGDKMSAPDLSPSPSSVERCEYFVPRKKRNCRMLVKPGKRFCGEHDLQGGGDKEEVDRMACPYDHKHTCSRSRLQKHLKKCRSRPEPPPHYCSPGANLPAGSRSPSSRVGGRLATVRSVADKRLLDLIRRLDAASEELRLEEVPEEILSHPAVSEATSAPGLGPAGLKHPTQNASLLGHLDRAGLLGAPAVYVEFGSGRGQLTFWLSRAAAARAPECDFLLVDRSSHRHKFDNRLKNVVDGEEAVSTVRLRADIADLVLARAPKVEGSRKPIVGVSKHLCGAATDLALRSLVHRDLDRERVAGIMIALCCHHRCDWDVFVGQDFLKGRGFDEEDFDLLCGLTSWATCGTGKPRQARKAPQGSTKEVQAGPEEGEPQQEGQNLQLQQLPEEQDDEQDEQEQRVEGRYDRLSLPRRRREEVGARAKLLMDAARLAFVREAFPALAKGARLVRYCRPAVSLENVVMVAAEAEAATSAEDAK